MESLWNELLGQLLTAMSCGLSGASTPIHVPCRGQLAFSHKLW
jgi:hypothetical protein